MKKLFTLLTMLIVSVGSSWADNVTVTINDQTDLDAINNAANKTKASEETAIHKYGTYSGSDVANTPYYTTFTTNSISGLAGVTISTTAKILKPTYVSSDNYPSYYGHVMAIYYDQTDNTTVHTFTLTAPTGYYIKTYSFKPISTSNSGGFTISAGGKDYIVTGATGTIHTIKNDVYGSTTTFTVKRNTTNNNSKLCIYNFTVVLETIGEATWNSGINSSDINNYYSNVWYLQLTSPVADDVFFDTFSLSHSSNGSVDDDVETYLAFTYNKFTNQNNHQANEFIAISSNSLSGHSSTTAAVKEYTFSETVRLNGNTDVYACFVSKNPDGTYSLRKRGLGVVSGGSMNFSYGNNYTTSNTTSSYTPYYSCTYTTSYVYPQTDSEYHIWWKNNVGDRTSDGGITISAIKMTSPGTTGQYVHFDQFSVLLRDADVTANTYLLFSKNFLLGSGVNTSTEFDPSQFTAVSTNKVPSANYGKVFDFQFDSNQYLEGNQTYYVYMGTKKENGNFCLCKYGLFINHQYGGNNTGFVSYQNLTTTTDNVQNAWCPIWYSNKCTFADQKVTVNIKEAGTTIRTKTLYSNTDIDLAMALNVPSVYKFYVGDETEATTVITHEVGSFTKDISIQAPFTPASNPASYALSNITFIKLNEKYAGGTNGNDLVGGINDIDIKQAVNQWVMGGNYYDGYTFYNIGKAKYLSVSNASNSTATFVDAGSKFIAEKSSVASYNDVLCFRLYGTLQCYLNDYDNSANSKISTYLGNMTTSVRSRVDFKGPTDLLSSYLTRVSGLSGTSLGKYNWPEHTQTEINTALINANTAYDSGDLNSILTSVLALKVISDALTINLPQTGGFYKIMGHATNKYAKAGSITITNVNDDSDPTSKIPNSTGEATDGSDIWYYDADKHLINYYNGLGTVATRAFASLNKTKETATFAESTCTADDATKTGVYEIKSNYTGTAKYWYSNTNNVDRNTDNDHVNCEWDVTEVTSLPVTFNSAALGYATFNSPVALKVPKDVKAYVCRIDGETIRFYNANKFTDEEGNWILPKNTAVLLYNKDYLTDATKYFTITSTTDEYEDGENDFTGTVAAASPASGSTYYSLRKSLDGTKVGFYERTSTATLAGFRAWIISTTGARNFNIVFDGDSDPTGIVEALGLENDNVEIYDLNGRKLSSYQKGINIVSGKKVFK